MFFNDVDRHANLDVLWRLLLSFSLTNKHCCLSRFHNRKSAWEYWYHIFVTIMTDAFLSWKKRLCDRFLHCFVIKSFQHVLLHQFSITLLSKLETLSHWRILAQSTLAWENSEYLKLLVLFLSSYCANNSKIPSSHPDSSLKLSSLFMLLY